MKSLSEESFGDLLRVLRRQEGLSQEDLAAASGSSVRTIRELERCRVTAPQRRTVQTVADALRLAGDLRDRFVSLAEMNRFIGSDARAARAFLTINQSGPGMRPARIPRQLPAALPDLVGRRRELSAIRRLADRANGRTDHHTPLVVVHGPPGVGKTSLAVAGAYQVSSRFSDGQLFADLRGSSTDGPAAAADVLAQLLRSLAVPDMGIPPPGTAREGLFRTLLRDRRFLIVLDDAFDEAQVRPLLPATPQSMVMVTCRPPLSGLDAAGRIRLDALSHEDARQLLAGLVGPRHAAADPDALDSLIRLCGRWPLALRIAGNRLASSPAWDTRDLLDRLGDRRGLLNALTAGDLDLRATFTMSYRYLAAPAATVFRSAAAIPGPDFDAALAAAAAGLDPADAAAACDDLVDAGLLQYHNGRYAFNDLVRLFAAECLDDAERDQRAADERIVRRLRESPRGHRDRPHDTNAARRPRSVRAASPTIRAARGSD